ncbi:MAG: type II secretion system protein [Patescibacteria group bacterium]|nr:type II secretion system protein [Patescibacteria group bacterium]
MKHTFKSGFTLIELLIVIALIAVLAGAVIIALNPARQFQQARNSERWSHVSVLSNAIQQNMAENRGTWTCDDAIPTSTTPIHSTSTPDGYDLCSCLVPNNLAAMPFDPIDQNTYYFDSCSDYNTGYTIEMNTTTNRITIAAPQTEMEGVDDITVTQ